MRITTIIGTALNVAVLFIAPGLYAQDAGKKGTHKPPPYPFGTITKTKRIPGKQDAKGDCRKLKQGGYMKFDLSKYPADKKITSATLRIFLEKSSGNKWRWVSLIKTDPTTGDLTTVFKEIEKHKPLISGIITLRKGMDGKWLNIRLNKLAVQTINQRLAERTPEARWIAMSFGFE